MAEGSNERKGGRDKGGMGKKEREGEIRVGWGRKKGRER